ncbi:hypothetical protein EV122DRAFT_285591 [Schizophyllum commune]
MLGRDNVVCSKRLASHTDASSSFDCLSSSLLESSSSCPTPSSPCPSTTTYSSASFYAAFPPTSPSSSSDLSAPSTIRSRSPSALDRPDEHPIHLHLEDGTVATCDVLIGADGLKSRVRVGMMERLVSEATRQAAGPAGAEGEVERAVAAGGREAWAKDAGAGSCGGRPAGTEAEAEALAAAAQPVWSSFVAEKGEFVD